MAGAAGGDLAREVAGAGGLGMIGTGSRATLAWLDAEWAKLNARPAGPSPMAPGPVGVGFISWALARSPEQRPSWPTPSACGPPPYCSPLAIPHPMPPHQKAKERILQATAADTIYTSVFDIVQEIAWPTQYAGRALRNDFTDTWHGREQQLRAAVPDLRTSFEAARTGGDKHTMPIYAGESVTRINDVIPAAELVRRIGEAAARSKHN